MCSKTTIELAFDHAIHTIDEKKDVTLSYYENSMKLHKNGLKAKQLDNFVILVLSILLPRMAIGFKVRGWMHKKMGGKLDQISCSRYISTCFNER